MLTLCLAAYTRFHLLGAQSLWNDEGNSYVQATRSLLDIPYHAARDIHPPGYYWLLSIWRAFTGDSEFALRALSAFASVLSVAAAGALGRQLYGTIAGVTAGLLVALNGFSIYYAQEARMYSLLALWGVLGMLVFVGFLTQRHRGTEAQRTENKKISVSLLLRFSVLSLSIINAAGLWTQYAYGFVMLAQGMIFVVWLVGARRVSPLRTLAYYIAANLLTLALYLPWLPTMLHQITTWPNTGTPTPPAEALSTILGWLAFGVTYADTNASILAIALILLLFGLMRMRRQAWRGLLPVLWVVLPLGLFLALELFRPANLKLLIPAQIGFALWIARGVSVLWGWQMPLTQRREDAKGLNQIKIFAPLRLSANVFRLTAITSLLLVLANQAAGLAPLYHDPAYQRADYRAIVRAIQDDLRPGDAIILDAPNQQEVFGYYYRGDAPVYPLPAGLGGDDSATRTAVERIIHEYHRAFVVFWGEAERDPNRVVETTLDAQIYEVNDVWYGDVRLARYAMPLPLTDTVESGARFGDHITLLRYALSAETIEAGDVLQVRLDWQTDAPLDMRYKVFVQLLDENGVLVAQRDSEPGGGLALTTTWTPGAAITDLHGLWIPENLLSAHYSLIIGLYNADNPTVRLSVSGSDYLTLRELTVMNPSTGESER